MNIDDFLNRLNTAPDSISFENTIACIDAHYRFKETRFVNDTLQNLAGQNNGSCKIFYFAQLQELDQNLTLNCFGDFYRQEVLNNPKGNNHQNIRNFMKHGWPGIQFDGIALVKF